LREERRAVLRDASIPSVGEFLYRSAAAGGSRSLGRAIGALDPGSRADFVVVDLETPSFAACEPDAFLDVLVFADRGRSIKDVFVGGRHLVADGRHVAREAVARRFRATLERLE